MIKIAQRYHHFTHVYQKSRLWCMLPEIWSATDVILSFWAIFCPFTPLMTPKIKKNIKNSWRYYPFTHVYHKWRSFDVWFLRHKAQKTEIFLPFWDIFYPLTLLTTRKIKLLENWKKMPGDIILHLSATNDDHMYGSWAQHTIFCNFGAIFCNQNSTSKIKILKK